MDRPKRKYLLELFAFWSVRGSPGRLGDLGGVRKGSVRGCQGRLDAGVGGRSAWTSGPGRVRGSAKTQITD